MHALVITKIKLVLFGLSLVHALHYLMVQCVIGNHNNECFKLNRKDLYHGFVQ